MDWTGDPAGIGHGVDDLDLPGTSAGLAVPPASRTPVGSAQRPSAARAGAAVPLDECHGLVVGAQQAATRRIFGLLNSDFPPVGHFVRRST